MDNYFNNYEKDKNVCDKFKYPKPKKIFLECGAKPQDAIFEIDDGEVKCDQSFVLDRVFVDLNCLFKPLVKIEFSCLVWFEAEDEEGSEHEVQTELLFKLIKTCHGKSECIQSWKYFKEFDIENDIDELEVEISEPFTVTFCDQASPCDKFGCCEYKMVVEGKEFEGEFDKLRVIKPDLSAIVQGEIEDYR